MNITMKTRQRIRRGVLFIFLLLFPIILNYFSPYVIIDGAMNGIINGSFLTFGLMFISSLFLGRLWCSWACPAGALQELTFTVQNKLVKPRNLDWIKWVIWVIWMGVIVISVIGAGGYKIVDPFHLTDYGISVNQPMMYIIYYIVIGTFLILSLTVGRRAGCHSICWMSPFMIIGRKIRNLVKTPALKLVAETEKCINCKKCTQACPMSLDVNGMVQTGKMEHHECILCGSCIDTCPQDVIHYKFQSGLS